MRVDVHHHFDADHEPRWYLALKALIKLSERNIMTTVNEAVASAAAAADARFVSIEGSLSNLSGDLAQQAAEIQSLKDLLAAGNTISAEAQATLDGIVVRADAIAAAAATLADVVKAPVVEPPVEPTV